MDQAYLRDVHRRTTTEVVLGTDPAAGAEASVQVPGGDLYQLVSVQLSLVTDATVADRLVRLQLSDGTTTILDLPAQAVQAASLTRRYTWAVGCPVYATGSAQVMPLPPLLLLPTWTLTTETDNLAAGDDLSGLVVLARATEVVRGPVDLGDWGELTVDIQRHPRD